MPYSPQSTPNMNRSIACIFSIPQPKRSGRGQQPLGGALIRRAAVQSRCAMSAPANSSDAGSRQTVGRVGFVWAMLAVSIGLVAGGCASQELGTPRISSSAEQSVSEPKEQFEPASDELPNDPRPLFDGQRLRSLEAAEGQYREIVAAGGWPVVPNGPVFRPGDGDPRSTVLSRRLAVSGDLVAPTGDTAGRISAAEVIAALKRFQARHGLRPSGLVDDPTLEALNVTAESRLAQLRINMVRMRDLSELGVPSPRYVLVNVPAFQLEAVEGNQVVQRHRVIVGRVERPTPSVSATIRNVNFFPYWNVPDSVAQLDLIPHVQKEPDYLEREHIRIQSGGVEIARNQVDWQTASAAQLKFRQDPGPWNALGLIRFDMPNPHTVYLHDTPMKNFFGQRNRAMSAGCVRVEGVSELAEWIMRDAPGWDGAKIRRVLEAGQTVEAALSKPVAVHFVYITAWAGSDGRVEFRSDLYGRDGISELVASYSNQAREVGARGSALQP